MVLQCLFNTPSHLRQLLKSMPRTREVLDHCPLVPFYQTQAAGTHGLGALRVPIGSCPQTPVLQARGSARPRPPGGEERGRKGLGGARPRRLSASPAAGGEGLAQAGEAGAGRGSAHRARAACSGWVAAFTALRAALAWESGVLLRPAWRFSSASGPACAPASSALSAPSRPRS